MTEQSGDPPSRRRPAADGRPDATARTPEELETMLEDALMTSDCAALAALFESRAVLVAGQQPPVRGSAAIVRWATAQAAENQPYIADPRHVVQARDLALIVADGAVNVACRDDHGVWRYVIACLRP
jgi:hypothetical protein